MASAVSSPGQLLAHMDLTASHYIALFLTAIVLCFLYTLSSPRLDPREPPIIIPSIPIIGHLLGFALHGIDYLELARKRYFARNGPIPAGTLPMLNGKVYLLFDRTMITTAIRHKNLTFDVLGMEFAQRVFGLSDPVMEKLWGPDHNVETSAAGVTMHRIKVAMQGQHLYRMNAAALNYIASTLNGAGPDGIRCSPNLYLWLRDFMTLATSEGIYGNTNPLRSDPSGLIEALWNFEGNMQTLFPGVLPKLIAGKAYANREKIQAVLSPWYVARKDEAADVAEITKVRANTAREFGIPDADIGRMELALLFVATTNTIPTLYWFLTNVWLRQELVEELRREAMPLLTVADAKGGEGREATLDISQLEERCPLMVSCYRESIRLGNQSIGTRRVLHDTMIADSDGNQHLFKAGVDIMWSVKAMHHSDEVWGEDVMQFEAGRFKEQDKFDRAKKQAYVPFGGGKHLCPGRNFAFAENLGFLAALVVGFEIHGLSKHKVRLGQARIGEAVAKPPVGAEGGEVVIKPRRGWDDVKWKFIC